MSAGMVQAVYRSDIKPLGVRMVALALAWHANDQTGEAWPANGTLASECGLARDRVRQCLKQLREAGVVEVVQVGTGGLREGTTRYRFTEAWLTREGGARHPGSEQSRERGLREGGAYAPKGGSEASPNRDERKPKASSSSKKRNTAAPAAARRARSAGEPAAQQQAAAPRPALPALPKSESWPEANQWLRACALAGGEEAREALLQGMYGGDADKLKHWLTKDKALCMPDAFKRGHKALRTLGLIP